MSSICGSAARRIGQRREVLATLIAGALALSSACSGTSTPPDAQIGALRTTDSGTAITVPALWAAPRSDGTADGGIEPTQVIVQADATKAGYTVDLSSIEAQGAGPSWEAATASAAAFATLFSGVDPAKVSLGFTITGPIDGPSAGGLLTCGLLAAFSGVPFTPGVTMTGTISPDGSIGTVGYIPRKVQAAAEAGYRTVIIPAEAVRDPIVLADGRTLDAYAADLGVLLVPVRTVGEAFAALTGRPGFYPVARPAKLTALTERASRSAAADAIAQLRRQLAAAPQDTDQYALTLAASALAAAQSALDTDDGSLAYGQATFGQDRLARARGAALVMRSLDETGLERTRTYLAAEVDAVSVQARKEIARLQSVVPTSLEEQSSIPTLLSWPVFALASVEGVRDRIATATDPLVLAEMGRIVADEQLALSQTLPDAEEILELGPAAPTSAAVVATLDAYTNLFDQAARANERYASDVLRQKAAPDESFSDQGLTASIAALRELAAADSLAGDVYGDVATRTAVAMTDFWFTSALVANAQAYGLERSEVADSRRAFATEAQNAAVDGASGTVDSIAALVSPVTPELPIWSAQWSTALSRAYRGTPESTEANWLAQSELWFDVMQLLMLRAMVTSPR